MGGEDWELWLDALGEAGVLAENCKTTAYTYIGKELTWPIYGHATIGKAKEDLDRAVHRYRNEDMLSFKCEGLCVFFKSVSYASVFSHSGDAFVYFT